MKVYRVVYRRSGSNDEWKQSNSSGSYTGRPYVNAGVAKAEATKRRYRNSFYEYVVQVADLDWEDFE